MWPCRLPKLRPKTGWWGSGVGRRTTSSVKNIPGTGVPSALPDALLMRFWALVMLAVPVLLVLLARKSLSCRTS